jgi:hypothetical protein
VLPERLDETRLELDVTGNKGHAIDASVDLDSHAMTQDASTPYDLDSEAIDMPTHRDSWRESCRLHLQALRLGIPNRACRVFSEAALPQSGQYIARPESQTDEE